MGALMKKTMHGYLVGVELEVGAMGTVTPEQVAVRLADAAGTLDGVVSHDVEYLGEIEQVDEADEEALRAFDSLTKN